MVDTLENVTVVGSIALKSIFTNSPLVVASVVGVQARPPAVSFKLIPVNVERSDVPGVPESAHVGEGRLLIRP